MCVISSPRSNQGWKREIKENRFGGTPATFAGDVRPLSSVEGFDRYIATAQECSLQGKPGHHKRG